MILQLFVGVASCLAIAIVYLFIREGVKDDLCYPIADCDTNMNEECLTGEVHKDF